MGRFAAVELLQLPVEEELFLPHHDGPGNLIASEPPATRHLQRAERRRQLDAATQNPTPELSATAEAA